MIAARNAPTRALQTAIMPNGKGKRLMGYTTEFSGWITVNPPLSEAESAFLQKFATTRRMDRERGPYFVDGKGDFGQADDHDIRDYNQPPKGQPGLWCQWIPTEDNTGLVWDGGEKFYRSAEWMEYLIDHFLKPGAIAKANGNPLGLADHVCNGEIEAQGEDMDDRWILVVTNNVVITKHTYG